MKSYFTSLLLLIVFLLCTSQSSDRVFLEKEKQLNYEAALNAPIGGRMIYIVITVTDLNTKTTKEICTAAQFLYGALDREYGEDSRKILQAIKGKRKFKFKNKEALRNLDFYNYNLAALEKVKTKYNFDSFCNKIYDHGSWEFHFKGNEHPTMEYMAHILFNRGYLTWEHSCWGGTLHYIAREDVGK